MIFDLFVPLLEKLYKEPAVRVPSLSRLSEIAKGLGLEMEESELMAYRGGNLSSDFKVKQSIIMGPCRLQSKGLS